MNKDIRINIVLMSINSWLAPLRISNKIFTKFKKMNLKLSDWSAYFTTPHIPQYICQVFIVQSQKKHSFSSSFCCACLHIPSTHDCESSGRYKNSECHRSKNGEWILTTFVCLESNASVTKLFTVVDFRRV